MAQNPLRNLPLIDELLESPQLKGLAEKLSRSVVVERVRAVLDDLKGEIQTAATERKLPDLADLAERIARRLRAGPEDGLRPAINAGGVLLGHKFIAPPLADEAVTALAAAASEYTFPAASRQALDESLNRLGENQVAHSFGSALLWTLATLAHAREVLVARGQVFETRRGERLTDLASTAEARLREVGSVNADTPEDYLRAIDDRTAAILWAPPADYAVLGSRRTSLAEVVEAARSRNIPVVAILEFATWDKSTVAGLDVPEPAAVLHAGANVVVLPGDQLIGGPRSGLIIGRRELIGLMSHHPLADVLDADAPTLAALAATLRLYREPRVAQQSIPILRLLNTPVENLKLRAERLAEQLRGSPACETAETIEGVTYLTHALLPGHRLPTWCVALKPKDRTAEQLGTRLAEGTPKVVCREDGDRLLFDLRSVLPRQDQGLLAAVAAASPA